MSSTDTQSAGQSPLHTELGTTTIQDSVVTAITSMAAEEVDGVATSHGGVRLPGDTSPTVGEFVDNITGGASRTRGLSVDVGERQTAADITGHVVDIDLLAHIGKRLRTARSGFVLACHHASADASARQHFSFDRPRPRLVA